MTQFQRHRIHHVSMTKTDRLLTLKDTLAAYFHKRGGTHTHVCGQTAEREHYSTWYVV